MPIFFSVPALSVFSDPIYKANVRAELVSDVSSVAPAEVFWVGLQMNMDDGWHTYWINSGDSGLPTKIEWDLPEGFTAGETRWPYPKRFDYADGLAGYGYEGEVLLLTPITVVGDLTAGEQYYITARVNWLSCREICVPGKADLSMTMGVGFDNLRVHEDIRKFFDLERSKWPQEDQAGRISVLANTEMFIILVASDAAMDDEIVEMSFFPYRNDIIQHAAIQTFEQDEHMYQLTIPRTGISEEPVQQMQGVLVFDAVRQNEKTRHSLLVDVPVEKM